MSQPDENPFATPASFDREPLAGGGAVTSGDASVTSVSYRVSLDDLRRGQSSLHSAIATVIGLGMVIGILWFILSSLPLVFRLGVSSASLPLILPAMMIMIAFVVATFVRRGGKGSTESPFETTVTLTPTELVIREEGLAELRRSWAGVGPLFLNKTTLRFDFQMYDLTQRKFMLQPGQIVPLRAFESEADAASFLATARRLIESADRSALPG